MEILKERYSITELSQRLEITDHTLRYYEKEFIIKIPKDERGRRFYTPELANIMYQIKTMRSEGLEIKAIKKILERENTLCEPPPVVLDEGSTAVISADIAEGSKDIRYFFNEFKNELVSSMSAEVATAREDITREITKSKLELGACVENGMRKLEAKMEKHFDEVDHSITEWRNRNRGGIFRKLFGRSTR